MEKKNKHLSLSDSCEDSLNFYQNKNDRKGRDSVEGFKCET